MSHTDNKWKYLKNIFRVVAFGLFLIGSLMPMIIYLAFIVKEKNGLLQLAECFFGIFLVFIYLKVMNFLLNGNKIHSDESSNYRNNDKRPEENSDNTNTEIRKLVGK